MLYVAGQKILVILSPHDALKVFKDTTSFAFDPFIDRLYRGTANVSNEAHSVLWRTPQDGFKSLNPNPKSDVLLLDPTRLQQLTEKVLNLVNELLRWDTFFKSSVISSSADTKVVSLHCWCRDVLLEAQSQAFFGGYLNEVEPQMTLILDEWDWNSWMMTFQYPSFMARAAIKPRDQLIGALTRYLKAPPEKRSGGVPFISELLDEELNAGLSVEDSARILLIILWGLNANGPMTLFWLIAHLLQRPELATAVREEISPAMQAFHFPASGSEESLTEITKQQLVDACPLLNSAFNEVVRVTSTGCTIREVANPVGCGGKDLSPGTKVLIPQRPMLLAKQAFGPDALDVDLSRFSKNRALERHSYYRPFGGGVTLCSGRVLGRREILAFVALALWRYEMHPLDVGQEALGVRGKPFPRVDEKKPSVGIAKQIEGDDMIVRIARRQYN
ncbi:MAG: hypothetical protein Q9197_004074 [Variospora fuerteventurae]